MEILPIPFPPHNRFLAVVGPHAAGYMPGLAARLALNGPLTLLDGGNRANLFPLARELRGLTHDPLAALKRIRLSRAFTCHQMLALLQETLAAAPHGGILILDLLSTFYDESAPLGGSRRLLSQSLGCILALSRSAPVIASARPPAAACRQRGVLLDDLRRAASITWEECPTPLPACPQPALPFPVR